MSIEIEKQRTPQLRHRPFAVWRLLDRVGLCVAMAAALVTFLPAAWLVPATAGESEKAGAAAQDLLFLGPLRPLWIRLEVTIDGRPYREVWRSNVQQVFANADADGDGLLHVHPPKGASGSKQGPDPDSVSRLAELAAVYLGQDVPSAKAALEKFAAEHGGTMTAVDFENYFHETAPPFAIAVGVGRTTSGQALFPLLDADGDQQLTRDELNAAEARLRIRDFDDNESLTRVELVDAPNSSLAAVAKASDDAQLSPLATAGPIALVDSAPPTAIREAILAEYDRNGDSKLSTSGESAEISPTSKQLARLGSSGSDLIDAEQLERFCVGQPDLALNIELGKVTMTSRRFGESRRRRTDDDADGPRLKQRPDGSWDVTLDDARIYLRRNNRDPAKNSDSGPGLQAFDADNNGYLDEKELSAAPNLAGAFAAIDADHDGKIFAGELDAYTDRLNRGASVRLLLEVFDQGQELFDHLDENDDYRLSTRELHNAAEIVKQIDANQDGRLSAGEIPQQLVLELSRNTPSAAVTERRSIRGGERVRTAAKRGPSWFQKMDRNDDGELSQREFLGTRDTFRRLDKDHNGVLDPQEAESSGS